MTMTVQKYEQLKQALDAAKEAEHKARLELVEQSKHTKKGSKTIVMDSYKVAITNVVNLSTYEPALEDVRNRLGDEAFSKAFKVKYEPSVTGLKLLTPEQLEIAEDAIVSKPGTPQVKIVKKPEDIDAEA